MTPTLTKSVRKIQGLGKRALSGQGFSAGSSIYRFKGKKSLGPSVEKKMASLEAQPLVNKVSGWSFILFWLTSSPSARTLFYPLFACVGCVHPWRFSLKPTFLFLVYLLIYSAALSPSCSMQDLRPSWWHVASWVSACEQLVEAWGI